MPGGVPWQTVLEQAAGPVAVLDLQARIIYANPALCELLGYSREYLLRQPPRDITHPDDPAIDSDTIAAMIAGREARFEMEKRYLRSDGSMVWAMVSSTLVRDADGEPCFFLSQIQDISARREAELLWRRSLEHAPIGIGLLDLRGYWTEVNDALCRLVGYRRAELLGKHFTELTYPEDQQTGMEALADLVAGRRETVSLEKRYRHRRGHPFWMLIRSSVVPGPDERPAYLVNQFETVGDGRVQNSHLAHMALHDTLTGLANRTLLLDRLEQERAQLAADGGILAVVLADIDNLKPVNDHHGHFVGDRLLITAADELLQAVNPGDTVARLGGDEFVVLSLVPDLPAAEAFRDRITGRLDADITVSGHPLRMSASVGLATTADSATSPEELLHDADRDMYRYKSSAR